MKTFVLPYPKNFKSIKKMIGTAACCAFLCLGGNTVSAQTNLKVKLPYDPNNNPAIWAQLQQNPLDSLLWQKYVNRQWTDMPLQQRLQIKLWIQEMWLNKLQGNNDNVLIATTKKEEKKDTEPIINTKTKKEEKVVIPTIVSSQNKEQTQNTTTITAPKETATTKSLSKSQKMQELLAKPEVKSFMKDLEESFLVESTEMEELKENLYENFFILEAVLADEFEALGAKYVFYKQKYPKGNYSESRWMMEKEQELKKLKLQKLEDAKQAFLERQIN